VRVLLDDERGRAGLAVDVLEHPEQALRDDRGEPERRLVEQQQARAGDECAGDGDGDGDGEHLLLAAGQAPGLLPAALGQAWEDVVPAVDVDLGPPAADVPADDEVLLDDEVAEGSAPLRHVRHAEVGQALRGGRGEVLAVEAHLAGAADHPGQRAQGRRLARAVRLEHDGDLALGDLQVHAVQHLHLAVARGQPRDGQQRHVSAPR